MASATDGIQQLLQAEKTASEKVGEARKRKEKRMKQAKVEAQQEIEKYREEREAQFRDHEAKHLKSTDDVSLRIHQEAAEKVKRTEYIASINKGKVIDMLLKLTCDVKPSLHANVRSQ
uniref:V-type proton ATPase subunit G n=1 Tax=Trichuris muris TaxID=70415 RepID=A0A5S6QD23_TRIMR